MTVRLYLAPARQGKTAFVLEQARRVARELVAPVYVCVPTPQQATAWRRRLAQAGGALGVEVLTFDALYVACLNAARESYTELPGQVLHRLLRTIIDQLELPYYAPLRHRPGFIQALQALISELKGALITPEAFLQAISAYGDPPRLRELGLIYQVYQEWLGDKRWADRAGIGWLAVEALERHPESCRDWPLLIVDGFDSFTRLQITLLKLLGGRLPQMSIALTGDAQAAEDRQAHGRLVETRRKLEEELGIVAELLPGAQPYGTPGLRHLERSLFLTESERVPADDSCQLLAAPDQVGEVREAMRWLKRRLAEDSCQLHEVALLARNLDAYRPFIVQIAHEFQLPISLSSGMPLNQNAAVAALLNLLRLALPAQPDSREPVLQSRRVLEAWRSPYFNWHTALGVAITARDMVRLDVVARWGRVVQGAEQWFQVLGSLAAREAHRSEDEEVDIPFNVPIGLDAERLYERFAAFVEYITPPPELRSYREWVAWFEARVGPDGEHRGSPERNLAVVSQARQADASTVAADIAALRTLKDSLRGLVWAEEAIGSEGPISFSRFYDELLGVIEGETYQPEDSPGIFVSDVGGARGLSFRAVALLGLAEGVFPKTLVEDPFLREHDRRYLNEVHGLPLELVLRSREPEYFYETTSRPVEQLLLTRPRLSESGAEWEPSPYWEDVLRLVAVEPKTLETGFVPPPERSASWAELMQSLGVYTQATGLQEQVAQLAPERWERLRSASGVFQRRYSRESCAHNGELNQAVAHFEERFAPAYPWSASQLELYRKCPFSFYTSRVLRVEPRSEPVEDFDAAQLGQIYHEILERLFRKGAEEGRLELQALLADLPAIAGEILEAAPRRQGFRPTAWWKQTCREIEENVQRSVEALAALSADFKPAFFEARFTTREGNALTVDVGGDSFQLQGVIDRVDVNARGQIRLIDYKTASASGYGKANLERGERLQLPLYALAARDALALGDPVDGFYWHIRDARPSSLTLEKFGVQEAFEVALGYAREVVQQARRGAFAPAPPPGGCPSYCGAAAFCWEYRAGW